MNEQKQKKTQKTQKRDDDKTEDFVAYSVPYNVIDNYKAMWQIQCFCLCT